MKMFLLPRLPDELRGERHCGRFPVRVNLVLKPDTGDLVRICCVLTLREDTGPAGRCEAAVHDGSLMPRATNTPHMNAYAPPRGDKRRSAPTGDGEWNGFDAWPRTRARARGLAPSVLLPADGLNDALGAIRVLGLELTGDQLKPHLNTVLTNIESQFTLFTRL